MNAVCSLLLVDADRAAGFFWHYLLKVMYYYYTILSVCQQFFPKVKNVKLQLKCHAPNIGLSGFL